MHASSPAFVAAATPHGPLQSASAVTPADTNQPPVQVSANLAEAIVFLVLGVELVRSIASGWNTGFVIGSIVICIVVRFALTFLLIGAANRSREGGDGRIRIVPFFSYVMPVQTSGSCPRRHWLTTRFPLQSRSPRETALSLPLVVFVAPLPLPWRRCCCPGNPSAIRAQRLSPFIIAT